MSGLPNFGHLTLVVQTHTRAADLGDLEYLSDLIAGKIVFNEGPGWTERWFKTINAVAAGDHAALDLASRESIKTGRHWADFHLAQLSLLFKSRARVYSPEFSSSDASSRLVIDQSKYGYALGEEAQNRPWAAALKTMYRSISQTAEATRIRDEYMVRSILAAAGSPGDDAIFFLGGNHIWLWQRLIESLGADRVRLYWPTGEFTTFRGELFAKYPGRIEPIDCARSLVQETASSAIFGSDTKRACGPVFQQAYNDVLGKTMNQLQRLYSQHQMADLMR